MTKGAPDYSNVGELGVNVQLNLTPPGQQTVLSNVYWTQVNVSTSGDNVIAVNSGQGKRIYVAGLFLIVGGDVDAQLRDGAGGAGLTGLLSFAKDGNGFVWPLAPWGYAWTRTSVDTDLVLWTSADIDVKGLLVYFEE